MVMIMGAGVMGGTAIDWNLGMGISGIRKTQYIGKIPSNIMLYFLEASTLFENIHDILVKIGFHRNQFFRKFVNHYP